METNVRVEVAAELEVVVAGEQCVLPENAELEQSSSCHAQLGLINDWIRMLVRRHGQVDVSVSGADCLEGYE